MYVHRLSSNGLDFALCGTPWSVVAAAVVVCCLFHWAAWLLPDLELLPVIWTCSMWMMRVCLRTGALCMYAKHMQELTASGCAAIDSAELQVRCWLASCLNRCLNTRNAISNKGIKHDACVGESALRCACAHSAPCTCAMWGPRYGKERRAVICLPWCSAHIKPQ